MYEILAYNGGFFLGIQLLPQIYKTYTQRNADNLSLPFMICNVTGLTCMGLYSLFNNDIPLLVPIGVSLCNTTVLIIMKIYYTSFFV